ncbi:unnamed protein product [Urochloa humidicola]
MDTEEEKLHFALLAASPAGHQQLPVEAMRRAIADIPGIDDDHFTVRRFAPENFLVVFGSQRERVCALSASSVPVAGVRLHFRPWTHVIKADDDTMRFRVSLDRAHGTIIIGSLPHVKDGTHRLEGQA